LSLRVDTTSPPGHASDASPVPRRTEPVSRCYRSGSLAIDDLVEVLYRLIVDIPTNASAVTQPSPGIDLLSNGRRVRNV
jgi:hypothetical protein